MVNHIENVGIAASGIAAIVISQIDTSNLPAEATWAQLGALTVCVGLLVWLITKRIPAIEDKHTETVRHIVSENRVAMEKNCETQRECHAELCAKIDENTTAVQEANHEHLTLLRTHLLKIDVRAGDSMT